MEVSIYSVHAPWHTFSDTLYPPFTVQHCACFILSTGTDLLLYVPLSNKFLPKIFHSEHTLYTWRATPTKIWYFGNFGILVFGDFGS